MGSVELWRLHAHLLHLLKCPDAFHRLVTVLDLVLVLVQVLVLILVLIQVQVLFHVLFQVQGLCHQTEHWSRFKS